MLPVEAYTRAEVFAWEQRHLLAGSWMCLGRTAELAARGNQHAVTVGDLGVLLTLRRRRRARVRQRLPSPRPRTAAGRRVVRTAGGRLPVPRLVLRPRRRAADRTPDGRGLRPAPVRPGRVAGGRLARLGVRQRHRYGDGASPITSAPWRSWSRRTSRRKLTVKASHRYEIAANWKVIAENYHECYHCPQIHPELCQVTPPNSGDNWHEPGLWVGGSMDLRPHAETMSLDGRSRGVMLPGVDPRTVRYLGLFPNLLLSLHPDYVMAHRLVPLAPDRTLHRVPVALRRGGHRPVVRGRLLGPHQPAGLGGLRVGAARDLLTALHARAAGPERERDLRLGHAAGPRLPGPRRHPRPASPD